MGPNVAPSDGLNNRSFDGTPLGTRPDVAPSNGLSNGSFDGTPLGTTNGSSVLGIF